MDTDVDAALRAIAEPRRRAILRLVAGRELTAGSIAERFEVTRPAVSQHLQVLKEAGLVTERREGTRRYYRADHSKLMALRDALDDIWSEGLRRFKSTVESDLEL